MLYVSSRKLDGRFGVTDTDDNVEDIVTKNELISLANKYELEIDGVDLYNNQVVIVKLPKDTLNAFKTGNFHLAISTMSLDGIAFGFKFRSKPTGGSMSFVRNEIVNIRRQDYCSYTIDNGTSKSMMSGVPLDSVLTYMEQFENWTITDYKVGRF
jgi:hypothetical protein